MDTPILIQHLEDIFAKLSVPVRYEPFDEGVFRGLFAGGGLCRVKGHRIVVINDHLDLTEKAAVLLRAAAALDISRIYMPPAVRREIHRYRDARVAPHRREPRLALVSNDEISEAYHEDSS